MLVFGPKAARAAVLHDLRNRPLGGSVVVDLSADGLFLSLSAQARQAGVVLDPYNEQDGLRTLAAAYATVNRRLVLVCDEVEKASLHDLGYLCRGVNATVNDASDGKPGILLVLMGSDTATQRRVASAWPDAEMGTQSHHLAD